MDKTRFKAIKIVMQRPQGNCPVLAVKTTIYQDNVSGKKVFVNEFKNLSEYVINSLNVRISCFDDDVKLIGTIKDYKYDGLSVNPQEEFGQQKMIASPSDAITSFSIHIKNVEFADEYYWNDELLMVKNRRDREEILVEIAPELESLSETLYPDKISDADFVGEISVSDNRFSLTPTKNDNPTEKNVESSVASVYDTSYSSSLGNVSSTYGENVSSAAPAPVVEPIAVAPTPTVEPIAVAPTPVVEPVAVAPTPVVEPVAVAPTPTVEPIAATVTPATAPVSAPAAATPTTSDNNAQTNENTVAQESDNAQVETKKKRKVPKFIKTFFVLVVVGALLVGAYIAYGKYQKYSDYNRGAAYLANGDYEYAIKAYTRLGNYEDSPALLIEAKKGYANQLKEEGRFEEAISMYYSLAGCEDKVAEVYDAWLLNLCENNEFDKAIEIVNDENVQIGAEVKDFVYYKIGTINFDNCDYETAIKYFSEIKDYEDSTLKIKESYYNIGIEKANVVAYESAIEAFEKSGDYKDSAKQIEKCKYNLGKKAVEGSDYEKAIGYFETVIEYEDAATLIVDCYYKHGVKELEAKNYESAMELLKKAEGVEGVEDKYYEALYNYLLEAMKKEVTLNTMDKLAELPKTYEDVATITKLLNKYVDHVGEYAWSSSNDKDINSQGGFTDHIYVELAYDHSTETVTFTVAGFPVDLKLFAYKSGTDSDTYTMLNTKTITRTFNAKTHTYKKVIEE